MKNIVFDGVVGDQIEHVELSQPNGTGQGFYAVMIDGYYNGKIIYQQGIWTAYLNVKSDLTTEDIDILRRLILDNEKHGA